MARYESLVEEIYADGGRKFLFLNAPPTSRSPFILAEGAQASEAHAAWVTAYNDGLDIMVERFRRKHGDVSSLSSVSDRGVIDSLRSKLSSMTLGPS